LQPPIVWDRDQPEFFSAVIERDNAAMPELADLAFWRNYVHLNGAMPKNAPLELASMPTGDRRLRGRIDVV
jgi:hypothetical protein